MTIFDAIFDTKANANALKYELSTLRADIRSFERLLHAILCFTVTWQTAKAGREKMAERKANQGRISYDIVARRPAALPC